MYGRNMPPIYIFMLVFSHSGSWLRNQSMVVTGSMVWMEQLALTENISVRYVTFIPQTYKGGIITSTIRPFSSNKVCYSISWAPFYYIDNFSTMARKINIDWTLTQWHGSIILLVFRRFEDPNHIDIFQNHHVSRFVLKGRGILSIASRTKATTLCGGRVHKHHA